MAETELSWAAGFFDGEGHTSARVKAARKGGLKNQRSISLSVGQRDLEPLERFMAAVEGIGAIYTREIDNRPYYTYKCSGEKVRQVIELLWPYLCSIKKEQATKALQDYDSRQPNLVGRP